MRKLSATPAMLAAAVALAVSIWWFAQLPLMPAVPGPELVPASKLALQVLISLQVLFLCLFGPLWVLGDSRSIKLTSVALRNIGCVALAIVPAWPLVTMLWLAAGIPFISIAASQGVAALVGLAVLAVAELTRRNVASAEVRRLLATSVGSVAAVCAWQGQTVWAHWVAS